jgi:AbrB family looped-hinge helix DNA binding protein
MRELLTIVTRKGQITVPAEVREAWGLKEGDKVAVSLPDPETQEVHLRPIRSVAELTFGAIKPRRRPEDFRALREAAKEEMAEAAMTDAPSPAQ